MELTARGGYFWYCPRCKISSPLRGAFSTYEDRSLMAVPTENSERGEKSRVLASAAIVSPARPRSCVRSFLLLPADSTARRMCN